MFRLILVDDHEVVRMGLRMVLEQVQGISIVGEAGSAAEALALCESQQPQLVIMDIRMPPADSGLDACQAITQRWPETQVIMLTSYADDALIAEAIQAGAVGYVLKQSGMAELVRAIEAVQRGEALLDPATTRRVLTLMRQRGDRGDPFGELTAREVDVLRLIAEGKSNAEIAQGLFLSDKTVRNHISIILSKLNMSNRVEAATYAVRHRIHQYRSP